ncbi:RsmB/NOP family class I SAM-dependent RNA methyltransferase [Gephyromycinifex aptenodytis]|uniref:RsmB/NOP family class I SAM-dependent RNA methyltransferase n=1 Tax=Gephyromycinifex aptenodytis TaxID=2716227 RepID=UPI001D01744F|nr:transcription antitermination factor NusB [Gephyromycinifex aptenodytis]
MMQDDDNGARASQREPERDPSRPTRGGSGRVSHGGAARDRDPAKRSAQAPSQRSRRADAARHIAFETLRAVDGGAYANLELPRRLRRTELDRRDAAFATELVYGVCRMRGLYDPLISRCAGRETAAIDAPVLDVLRLGAHQLLGMRVPAHAAVAETVALARDAVGAGAAGFVNAVLRRISEKSLSEWLSILAPGAGRRAGSHGDSEVAFEAPTDLADVAVARSHPAWVVRALRAALLAHEASTPQSVDADLLDLLHAHNTPADVALVARPGLAEISELEEAGASRSSICPTAAVLTHGGDPGRIPAVRQGRAAAQDEGSQLLVLALLDAYDKAGPGTQRPRWLDLCAGPGGKVALLAAAAIESDATVFANEVAEHRAELVHSAVRAAVDAGADVLVGVGDGRQIGEEEPSSFDLVLLDAPCTGLGALRRRPEARWRREPSDVAELSILQRELLTSAIEATAPGGIIGYATCTPHPAETQVVVGDVVAERGDVEFLDARDHLNAVALSPLEHLGPGPFAQMWPHLHGTDAMFLALLRRRESAAETEAGTRKG